MKNSKSILVVLFTLFLIAGCSTNNDSNDNSLTKVVPLAPSNLTATIVNNQVKLTWIDNSIDETGFIIERMTGTGSWSVNSSVVTDILTYTDAEVTTGTTYSYRLYSFNSVGNSLNCSNLAPITIPNAIIETVAICNQIWTTKNLDVTTYSDGTPIPQVTDPTAWANLTTGAWCYYNNDSANGATYGKLYNGYAVAGIYNATALNNVALRKQLAPIGYHIPNDFEWTTLTNCLGGEAVAGGKMKEIGTLHWKSPNTAAINSSGFKGLPGGYRNMVGTFGNLIYNGGWWSSPYNDGILVGTHLLNYDNGIVNNYDQYKSSGYSVRCLKD